MADTTSRIQLIIEAQNKAGTELAKLATDMNQLNDKTKASGLSMGKLLGYLGGAAAGYAILKKGIFGSVKAYEESEKVMKQTEAVLASTKGVSGQTAKSISDLAMKMQTMSTFSDEAVQSAENLLLTFTNITTNFGEATQAVVDMSVALGTDLSGSAIQVGKALQDPILGITALKRVGVSFNDTQRETIKKLVETGHGMEAQKLILRELAIEFGGSAAKQLQTFGGRLEWAKNQASELQEGLGFGLLNSLLLTSKGVSKFLDNMTKLSKELETAQENYQKILDTGDTSKIKKAGDDILEIQSRIDIANTEMMQRVNENKLVWANYASGFIIGGKMIILEIINIGRALGDLSIIMLGGGLPLLFGGFREKVGADINAISEQWKKSNEEMDQAMADNRALIMGTGESIKEIIPPIKNFGEGAKEMAKKVEEATKKIKDLKDEMKKAVASAKQDIKDLKEEFNKNEVKAQQDLGKSIADVIVQKQKDMKTAQDEYNKATTVDEKKTATDKIKTLTDFFNAHIGDQQTYSAEILAAQQYAAMDEIQQLQFKFAEEKKQRLADYEDQMKDLKQHLKDVEKEYKKKLKDLKDDLTKELGDIKINIDINKSSKKALGGAVSSGQSYIVGENRPEVFVPSQSGNIRQTDQVGGREVNINFNNVSVRNDNDLDSIVRAVRNAINKEQEFYKLGAM